MSINIEDPSIKTSNEEVLSDIENEKEQENENEKEQENECVESEDLYVLSVNNKPVFYSDDYHSIRKNAEKVIQKTASEFIHMGNIFVSQKNDTYTLTYYQRNFLWNTERVLQTLTIHKVKEL
jgi:hypothetical protein